jgi:hypothetical protein
MISGNYSDDGGLIVNKIPTVTTDFCEIGAYSEVCYFTVIMKSDLFSKELLVLLSEYPSLQIYGLRNFLKNYYPKEHFDYPEFEKQTRAEEYTQIQFSFDKKELSPKFISDMYQEIKLLFEKENVRVENQLNKDFKVS